MSIVDTFMQRGVSLGAPIDRLRRAPIHRQRQQLLRLLREAQQTQFGRFHDFAHLTRLDDPIVDFQRQVPATDYHGLYDRWWHKAHLHDTPDVCWPGVIPYYALSSGTSQAASKFIPLTEAMLRQIRRGSQRMFFDVMTKYHQQPGQFRRQMLMVGSCTSPQREGLHHSGDLSGILGLNRPGWLEHYYRPGRHITDLPDWDARFEEVAKEAPTWDIGFAVGNPMWMQIIFEKIIDRYGVQNIHEVWPNFSLYVHGGVFFEPYRTSFEQLLGHAVHYMDSYLASEGFFGYQTHADRRVLRLLPDSGVFFEFVPFNASNFDDNGDLLSAQPEAYAVDKVIENQDYALLLSTCSGAWRYLLGDTVQFTDAHRAEFRLTGRTKQFLSVCGEHLSIDNLNEAVRAADRQLHAGIREFTVAGQRDGSYWMHQWYVSMDNPNIAPEAFAQAVDEALHRLNDDYAVERIYALRRVEAKILPQERFLEWLALQGKMNGQAKIPRVLKGAQLDSFQSFIAQKSIF